MTSPACGGGRLGVERQDTMAKDAAYREAEKKIQEALESGATELDLSGTYSTFDEEKLSELPDSLWECKQLESLTISRTKLTTLPDSLGQLTQLTNLNLSSNQLTTLPDSLGQLTQLWSLELNMNRLTTLPKSLGQLKQLRKLYLSNN
jgi:Leucine-rich repeat (LRR) protein